MAKTQVNEAVVKPSRSKKYQDLIFPDEKQSKNAEKQEAIEDAEANIYNAIVNAKKEVRTAQKAYDIATRTVPFNATRTLESRYALENAATVLSDLEALKEELF